MGDYEIDLFLKLTQFGDDYFNFKLNDPSIIYHYTPLSSAFKITSNFSCIIGGCSFIHTRFDKFKDTTEGSEINKIYQETLSSMLSKNKITLDQYNNLKKYKCDDTYFFYEDQKQITVHRCKGKAFICCFSKNGDKKYFWDNYLKGENEGCSISFHLSNMISEKNHSFGYCYHHLLKRVIYKKEDKMNYIEYFVLNMLSLTKDPNQQKFFIQQFLNNNRFTFKDEEFSTEEEIRSIIIVPEENICDMFNSKNERIIYKLQCFNNISSITFYKNKESNFALDKLVDDLKNKVDTLISKYTN